jgi:hypothetical protein
LEPDNSIWVETIVSHRTGEPIVQIAWYDHIGQFAPADARQLAMQLLEASAVAETDAFLCRFLKEKIGIEEAADYAAILQEFRAFREETERR